MKIALTNRQTRYRAAPGGVRKLCAFLRPRVEALCPGLHLELLSLAWLDDDRIRALNLAHFGRDRITDVISFCYPPIPGAAGHTGELLVNLDQAWNEGRLRAGPDRELARYIAHGMHHLAGAEDDTPARKRRMLSTEAAWIRAADAEGLVSGLLTRARRASSGKTA
ncbi:MAG: rRNA maturation RNase YbeY [Kiritimatiellia bacterium]